MGCLYARRGLPDHTEISDHTSARSCGKQLRALVFCAKKITDISGEGKWQAAGRFCRKKGERVCNLHKKRVE